MKNKISIIGIGNLGTQILKILKDKYGSENLFPTRKNKKEINKLKDNFPNISDDNIYAVKNSEIILLIVHPKDVKKVVNEISPYINDKLLINLTSKEIELKSPIIHIACSPVVNNKINTILYRLDKGLEKEDINRFKEIFKPLTKNFIECDNPVKELGMMSRLRAHVFNYYILLLKEGNPDKNLKAHFDLVIDSLIKAGDTKKQTEKAKTKGGFTEEINNLYNKKDTFRKLVQEESEAINNKIKEIEKD